MAENVNLVQIAKITGIHRTTLYGLLRGRKPQRLTRQKLEAAKDRLRDAGLQWPPEPEVTFPGNVAKFARRNRIAFDTAENLLSLRLKPVEQMSSRELNHIITSLASFPDLYRYKDNRTAD